MAKKSKARNPIGPCWSTLRGTTTSLKRWPGAFRSSRSRPRTERRLNKAAHGAKDPINVVAHFDPRGTRSRRYDFIPTSNKAGPHPPATEDGNLDHYEAMVYTPTVIEPFAKEIGIDPTDPAGRCRSLWRRAR